MNSRFNFMLLILCLYLLPVARIVSAQTPAAVPVFPRGESLKPFVIDMMAILKRDDGTAPPPPVLFHDTLTKTIWHGHKAIKRETATTRPGGKEFVGWAVVIFDQKTLLPYFSEFRRADGLFLRREYDGVQVKETRTSLDVLTSPRVNPGEHIDTVTAEFVLPEPAYTWLENSGLPILLALPLHAGLEGSVPVISGDTTSMKPCAIGPCYVLRMSYHVTGPEMVMGISGKSVLAWKIWVPETKFTFWITCKHPRLEQVTWPGPKGLFAMEKVG